MKKHNQTGAVHASVLVAALMSVLFVFALTFAFIMLMAKQDLSTNMDKKVATQVAAETKVIEAQKEAELAEKEKSPTKVYNGPSTLASVTFNYPKTYSAYVSESTTSTSGTPVAGYFYPNIVPKDDKSVSYALRLEIVSTAYDALVKTFDASLKAGKVTVKAFRATAVPDTLGVRIDGEIATGKQGSLILLPARDKTIKLWTEGKDYIADFNTYVVPSLSFVP